MKRILTIIFINIILVLAYTSFFSELVGPQLNPVIVLSFALSLLFMDKREEALLSAFTGGLMMDLLSNTIPGITPALFLFVVQFVFFVRNYVFRNWMLQLFLTALSAYAYKMFLSGAVSLGGLEIAGSLLTAAAVPLFYYLNVTFLRNLIAHKRSDASSLF
jgi:hypothetical protein